MHRALLTNALRKKDYKEAIRIERISSDDQSNLEGVAFGDWKEWDPLSSGEGDLPPFDDISKLFAAVSELPKSPAIDFSHANQFSLKDHISTAEKNLHVFGEKETPISCSEEPGSDAAARFSSHTNVVQHEDRKSGADVPSGLCANCEESAIAIAVGNNEFLGSSIGNDVASDSPDIPSPDIPLDPCTFMGKDTLLSAKFNLSSASSVDKMSTMCIEDTKSSDRTSGVSVAIGIPRADTRVAGNISDIAACCHLSNGTETSSTMYSQKVLLEEQIKAHAIEREGNTGTLCDDASLQICSVEHASSIEREGTGLFPDDVSFEDVPEIKIQTDVLFDGDTCMEEVLFEVKDQKQQQSAVTNGCASCRLKSGSSLLLFGNTFKGFLICDLFQDVWLLL